MTLSSFLEVQTALSEVAGHTYLMMKDPGQVRLLPTSDTFFKLFTELVRAARRTVESGISSLCDVTFRMRGVKGVTLNWNNI